MDCCNAEIAHGTPCEKLFFAPSPTSWEKCAGRLLDSDIALPLNVSTIVVLVSAIIARLCRCL